MRFGAAVCGGRSLTDHQINQRTHTCKFNFTLTPFFRQSSTCNTHLMRPYDWRQSNLRFKQTEYELEVCKNTTICPIKSKCMSLAPGHVTIYFRMDLSLISFSMGDPHHYFTALSSYQHQRDPKLLLDSELLLRFVSPNSAVSLRSALILSRSVNIGFITILPSFL